MSDRSIAIRPDWCASHKPEIEEKMRESTITYYRMMCKGDNPTEQEKDEVWDFLTNRNGYYLYGDRPADD